MTRHLRNVPTNLHVVKVMVHVEDFCFHCGGPFNRVGLADYDGERQTIKHVAKRIGIPELCPACKKKDQEQVRQRFNAQRRRDRWVKKAKAKVKK